MTSEDKPVPPEKPKGEGSSGGEVRWDRERARQLLHNYAETRDTKVKDELVAQHLNLVRYLAGKFSNRGENLEDLIQVGCLGLIKAIERSFSQWRFKPGTSNGTPQPMWVNVPMKWELN